MRLRSARGSERRASRSLDPRGSNIVLVVLGMQSPSLSQTRRRFLLFTSLSRFLAAAAVMNGCSYAIAMQLCPITSSRCGAGFIALFCRAVPLWVHCLLTFCRLHFEVRVTRGYVRRILSTLFSDGQGVQELQIQWK